MGKLHFCKVPQHTQHMETYYAFFKQQGRHSGTLQTFQGKCVLVTKRPIQQYERTTCAGIINMPWALQAGSSYRSCCSSPSPSPPKGGNVTLARGEFTSHWCCTPSGQPGRAFLGGRGGAAPRGCGSRWWLTQPDLIPGGDSGSTIRGCSNHCLQKQQTTSTWWLTSTGADNEVSSNSVPCRWRGHK